MKLKIEIKMDNAAFEEDSGGEAARILKKLVVGWAGSPLAEGEYWKLMDYNGNCVGKAEITD
jgi:hypothetical protein